jgi:hypothetical protein
MPTCKPGLDTVSCHLSLKQDGSSQHVNLNVEWSNDTWMVLFQLLPDISIKRMRLIRSFVLTEVSLIINALLMACNLLSQTVLRPKLSPFSVLSPSLI